MCKYRKNVYYDIKSRFLVILSNNHRHRLVLEIPFPEYIFPKISKYRTENLYFPSTGKYYATPYYSLNSSMSSAIWWGVAIQWKFYSFFYYSRNDLAFGISISQCFGYGTLISQFFVLGIAISWCFIFEISILWSLTLAILMLWRLGLDIAISFPFFLSHKTNNLSILAHLECINYGCLIYDCTINGKILGITS